MKLPAILRMDARRCAQSTWPALRLTPATAWHRAAPMRTPPLPTDIASALAWMTGCVKSIARHLVV